MTANTQHIIIREKWRCWSLLLLLLLSACSDYEYSIYDPLSPNYIDKDAPVAEEVDLGLSVNWASWNVGATAPEEYGNYYAWGEVRPRNNYTKDSYIYYNGDGIYTNIGGDICSTSYDVAHVKWGNGWRMPTRDECNELMNKCSWTWTTINGTSGQKISGSNGKSIFLPAAGHISGTKKESLGLYGNYWTGSLILENDDYSHYLYFGLQGSLWSYWQGRFYGFSVRPVKDKEFKDMSIAELLKTGEGTAANVQGTIVAKHTRGILLYDETGYILVNMEEESGDTRHTASNNATRSASSYTEGDVVTVEGVVTSDAGLPQFPSISKIQKVGSAEVVHPEPEVWNSTAFYNYFDNISVRYVKYTGILSKEDDDYIVTVSDSAITAIGQITYPASDLINANDEGEKVQVTGYAIGYTDEKHVRTMVTSVKVVEQAIDETAVAEAVDLGLSVKWASWNVGATAPEEYGGYYAWGETEVKDCYDWSTYKWCNGDEYSMTKYSTSSSYGAIDNKTTLDPEDDAAHVKWGSAWRMPTVYEIEELIDECSWSWTSQNGINGYKVIGPNGNSIFLPAAGYRNGTGLDFCGSDGCYWSGSLSESYSYGAYYLYFNSGYYYWDGWNDRPSGRTVRPVQDEDPVEEEPIVETIAGVLASGEDKPVKTQGTIVATHAQGILLHDETGYIHVRLDANTDNVVGDVVTVKGNLTPWGGILEFATGARIEKVGTAEVVHPEPVVWDGAALDNYLTSPIIQYVQYTGVLSQNEWNYNVTVDGATTAIGSIDCSSTDMLSADWIGKKVTVTGYTYGCSDEHSVSTMAISVEVVEDPIEEEPIAETIEGILASGAGKPVKTQGTIVATHAQGILLHDETGYIHVHLDANTDNLVGDMVTVTGNLTPWGGLLEFAAGATIEKVGTAEVVHPELVVWDGATLDSYLTSPTIQYVQYTGTLSQNDGFYNITVDDATTAVGRVLQPSYGLLSEEYVGQRVKLTGYTVGSTGGKYVETMVTAVEVVAPPIKDMTIAELLAAGEGTTAKVQATIVATHTRGFLLNDGTGYMHTHLGEDRGYTVGDVVAVTGDAATLNGLLSFLETAVVEKVGTAEVVHPESVVWDGAALDSYLTSPTIQYVQYTGTLSLNDGFYNITVDGTTTAVGRVLQPSDGLLSEEHVGQRVMLTGYTVGCTGGKYVETMVTAVEVVEEPVDETSVAEAVDLGLSVKWASWNIGATKPEGHGGYYAWGETETKATYDWTTYKYSNGSYKTLTKYCIDNYYGITDNKTLLDLEDDVAHVKWGDGWRMPTHDEITELCNECSWEWTTVNAVEGYTVTGPNGNSIFLPASGNRRSTGVNNRGVQGLYWSRTCKNYEAFYIYFFSDLLGRNHDTRAYGLPVRPVKEKEPNVDMDDYPEDEDWSEQ